MKSSEIVTLVNAPNWDGHSPATVLAGPDSSTIAFCANANVHVLKLTEDGFTHVRSVGFSAKFKKQFCRCTTALLLSETSMLVALDKRTIVWQKDPSNSETVSVGDVVIDMEKMP